MDSIQLYNSQTVYNLQKTGYELVLSDVLRDVFDSPHDPEAEFTNLLNLYLKTLSEKGLSEEALLDKASELPVKLKEVINFAKDVDPEAPVDLLSLKSALEDGLLGLTPTDLSLMMLDLLLGSQSITFKDAVIASLWKKTFDDTVIDKRAAFAERAGVLVGRIAATAQADGDLAAKNLVELLGMISHSQIFEGNEGELKSWSSQAFSTLCNALPDLFKVSFLQDMKGRLLLGEKTPLSKVFIQLIEETLSSMKLNPEVAVEQANPRIIETLEIALSSLIDGGCDHVQLWEEFLGDKVGKCESQQIRRNAAIGWLSCATAHNDSKNDSFVKSTVLWKLFSALIDRKSVV
jgi:hypothetical protein